MGRTILSSITTTSFIYKVVGKMTATEAPLVSAPQVQDGKSPVKEKKPEEVQEEATTFLTTGKRHLLVKDIPAAVSEFAQACELLSATFGETGKECAEAYYYYGKALLEMSRLESGVLGNALDGVPEEEDEANSSKVEDPAKMTDEEKKEVAEKVEEALKENLVELEKKDEVNQAEESKTTEDNNYEVVKEDESKKDEDKKDDDKKEEDEGMEEGEDSQDDGESNNEAMETEKVVEGEGESVAKEGDEKTADKKDEEEEPSNLQLAWEMLELAKVIYTKVLETADDKDKKAIEEKLCRAILTLGEVSIENENYSQAVEDIKMCLKKQEGFSKDSRLIAETQYQLGVAQGFNSEYDEAVQSLNSAIQIIKERVKNIKGLKNSSEDKKIGELEASIYEKEIEEPEVLIPEIEEKITDTKDMKKEAETKQASDKKAKVEVKPSGDVKSVSTIAVKRKAEESTSPNKKTNNEEKTAAAV